MTIRPGAPAYLDIPYSGADIMNGAAKPVASANVEQLAEAASQRSGPPRPRTLISDITEEKPLPADTEDALFQAADKAYRIAAGSIKFHEAQLRRWRAVAASFAGLSGGEAPAGAVVPSDVAQQFLDLVNNLPEGAS